ncbi:MAG: hypothetical protein ACI8QT_001311, partial [Halioglobus sp.]
MADDNSISYSYQSGSPAPQPVDNNAPLYAFINCERVVLQNGGVLLLHKLSDAQMIIAPEVSIALASCSTFQTLAKHVDVLTSTIPQLAGQQADVTKVLEMVRDAGLFTSAEDMCKRISSATTAADLPRTRVFVITCDRPEAVQRLVQSMLFAGNLSRHEELFLIDDSRSPENAELNRQLVEQFNLTSPRDMRYVGASAQQQLLNALIQELPEHEAGIRFLIDRKRWADKKSYGLARTLCLLLSVDSRAIVMDDDVICAAVDSPYKADGVGFGDTAREVEFYASEQDILSRTEKMDMEPLTGHAQCLGLNLAQALEKLGAGDLKPADLQGANGAFLSQWDAESQVIMTQSGTMGDPGTPLTDWVYSVDPASAQRLLASPDGLEGALTNRHYWMGQPKPLFTKMAVISQMTGMDNSKLLPPYFPVFRGEDYLFGAMVEYLHPQSTVLEYDWCVPHFPIEPRSGNADSTPPSGKGAINMSKYITDHTRYETGISAETRLLGLCQLLRELSETSDQGLLTRYRAEVAESQNSKIKDLTAKLGDNTPRTQVWNEFLQATLNNASQAQATRAELADIPRMPDGYQAQDILDEFRAYTGDFAQAL